MSVRRESQVHLLLSLQWQLQRPSPSRELQSSRCPMSMARGRRLCAIVPTVWPLGARLSKQFLQRGQVPTRTPPQCLFKPLLLLWGPVAWGKAGLDFGVDYLISGGEKKLIFLIEF